MTADNKLTLEMAMNSAAEKLSTTPVPLTQFTGYFLWLGTVGFGGPIALAGRLQQDFERPLRLVE